MVPANYRGILVSFNQVLLTLGIFMNYFLYWAFITEETRGSDLIYCLVTCPPIVFSLLGAISLKWTFPQGQPIEMWNRRLPADVLLLFIR